MQRPIRKTKVTKEGSMDFKQVVNNLEKLGIKVTTDTKKQLDSHQSIIVGNKKK